MVLVELTSVGLLVSAITMGFIVGKTPERLNKVLLRLNASVMRWLPADPPQNRSSQEWADPRHPELPGFRLAHAEADQRHLFGVSTSPDPALKHPELHEFPLRLKPHVSHGTETDHGSSLSSSAFVLVACYTRREVAEKYARTVARHYRPLRP